MAAGGEFLAVLYGTGKARVRLVAVTSPATRAGAVISNECPAQAAIHTTRRNDHWIFCLNLHNYPISLRPKAKSNGIETMMSKTVIGPETANTLGST